MEELTAWLWHLNDSSPFPLSPTASRDAPIYARSYHQVMQQRTHGCAQKCSRRSEMFGTKRKPDGLWICDMEDMRERKRVSYTAASLMPTKG